MNLLTYFDIKRLIYTDYIDIEFNNNIYNNKSYYLKEFIKKYNNINKEINYDLLNTLDSNNNNYITNLDHLLKNYLFNNRFNDMSDKTKSNDELSNLTKLNNFVFLNPRLIKSYHTISSKDNIIKKLYKKICNKLFKRNIQIAHSNKINTIPLGIKIICKKNINVLLKITIKPEYRYLNYTILNNLIPLEEGLVIDKVFIHCDGSYGFNCYQDIFHLEFIS